MASKPPLPMIIISDHTRTPPLAISYHAFNASPTRGDNHISFNLTYKRIKSLIRSRPCYHPWSLSIWPCPPCETGFTTRYWNCAAKLLDYFADFYAKDTALMQSLWFHLFDVWQEGAAWLPTKAILNELYWEADNGYPWPQRPDPYLGPASEKSKAFEKDIRETVQLIEDVIWGSKIKPGGRLHTWETVLYDPHGESSCPVGDYDTGPWVSGVKPWAQFLGNGGPGVAPPVVPRPRSPSPPPAAPPPGTTDSKPEEPVITEAAETTTEKTTVTRYIPHPAIGLLDTHVARAQGLATKYYASQSLEPHELTSALETYARYNPVFPTARARTHTYTSALTTDPSCRHPRTITYTLGNGMPPVLRWPTGRYLDAEMQVEDPDWNMLDECVAMCKGIPPYEAAGAEEEEEEGEDGEEEWAGDEDVFDMWTVVETREEEEEEQGNEEPSFVLGEMFDTWCGIKECDELE